LSRIIQAALIRARRRHARGEITDSEMYQRHRWRAEGVHGEAKSQHGLRRAARRGRANVSVQAYLTAAVMNLKRLAAFACAMIRPLVRGLERVPVLPGQTWAVAAPLEVCLPRAA